MMVILLHFDMLILPQTWMNVFCDGSLAKGTLMGLLLLGWAAGLHICTSSLSVGERQANVFFTSWVCKYISTMYIMDGWRVVRMFHGSLTTFRLLHDNNNSNTAFGSVALNYGVWRESAGLPSLSDILVRHHRETTYK